MNRAEALQPLSPDHLKSLLAAKRLRVRFRAAGTLPMIEEALGPDDLNRLASAIERPEEHH